MSLLVRAERRAYAGPWGPVGPGYDGRSVPTPEQDNLFGPTGALRVAAVVACVGLRSGVYAQIPLRGYVDDPKTGRPTLAVPQPELYADPSDTVVPSVWKIQMSISRDIWGWAFGRITAFDGAMYAKRVEWLPPDRVRPQVVAGGELEWRVNGQPVDPSLYLHVPSRWVLPGCPQGMSPLEYSGLVDLARVAQRFGRDWFYNGAVPSAIIYSDEVLKDEEQERLLAKLMSRWRARKPAVLGTGLRYEKVAVAANESQFLETIQHLHADIAVSYNIPPTKIGVAISGSAITYQTLEQNQASWMVDGMNPDLVVVSESLDRHTRPGVRAEWATEKLLRSDLLTRYRAYEIGIRSGWLMEEEPRAWEGLAPLPAGWQPKGRPAASASDLNANADGMTDGGAL